MAFITALTLQMHAYTTGVFVSFPFPSLLIIIPAISVAMPSYKMCASDRLVTHRTIGLSDGRTRVRVRVSGVARI